MKKITIQWRNDQKKEKLPNGLKASLRKCCEAVLDGEGFIEPAEVSVTFVDNEKIRALNNQFRSKDAATDVLSFPLGEDGEFDLNPDTNALELGDIVISLERAREQSEEFGHSFEREVAFLTVHSMLHLLGYDHVDDPEGEKIMREKQTGILEKLGIIR